MIAGNDISQKTLIIDFLMAGGSFLEHNCKDVMQLSDGFWHTYMAEILSVLFSLGDVSAPKPILDRKQ